MNNETETIPPMQEGPDGLQGMTQPLEAPDQPAEAKPEEGGESAEA